METTCGSARATVAAVAGNGAVPARPVQQKSQQSVPCRCGACRDEAGATSCPPSGVSFNTVNPCWYPLDRSCITRGRAGPAYRWPYFAPYSSSRRDRAPGVHLNLKHSTGPFGGVRPEGLSSRLQFGPGACSLRLGDDRIGHRRRGWSPNPSSSHWLVDGEDRVVFFKARRTTSSRTYNESNYPRGRLDSSVGQLASEQLVKDYAQGVDVRAVVDFRRMVHLLGSHVSERPHQLARAFRGCRSAALLQLVRRGTHRLRRRRP